MSTILDGKSKDRLSPGEAIEYLNGMSYQWFDMPVINAFNRCIAPYPIGTSVRLNTGAICIVVKNKCKYTCKTYRKNCYG